jgi:hypothetical protein
MGRGRTLYALSQGHFGCDDPAWAGSPSDPGIGALMKANADGTFTTVADGLDRPTSLEIVGTTAYAITLTGETWSDDISSPPNGQPQHRGGAGARGKMPGASAFCRQRAAAGRSSCPKAARSTNWPTRGSATSSPFSTSTFPRSRTVSGEPVTSVPSYRL